MNSIETPRKDNDRSVNQQLVEAEGSSGRFTARSVLTNIGQSIGFDWPILVPMVALCLTGLLMIYSTGGKVYFVRQLLWLPIAVATLVVCYWLPRRLLYALAYPLFGLSTLLLIMVLVIGDGAARRWFHFGPVTFQPSEFAKLATVIALARYGSDAKRIELRLRKITVPLLLVLVPLVLVLVEPDLGSAMIFLPVLATVLYVKGMRPFHLLLIFSPVLSLIAAFSLISWTVYFVAMLALLFWLGRGWERVFGLATSILVGLLAPAVLNQMHGYQKARMLSFLMPWSDPKGIGWNILQSLIAVGSGRLIGKGLLGGTQQRLQFLPNRHTDFVFSCVGEEFGFVGAVLVLIAYGYLLYRCILVASETRDEFGRLMVTGLVAVFAYHIITNTAMVLGLAPVTGIALPFLSYGGSQLVTSFAALGLILNVRHRPG